MTSAARLVAVAQRLLDARAAVRCTERPTVEDPAY